MKFLHRSPIYPILFAAYPVLALFANNLGEIEFQVIWRPLIAFIGLGALIYGLLYLLIRNWPKAALVTSYLLLLLFSYGHVYLLLRGVTIAGIAIYRHRVLAVLYLLVLIAGLWFILKRIRPSEFVSSLLTVMVMGLLIFPVAQTILYLFRSQAPAVQPQAAVQAPLQPVDPEELPDIYYIILDTYARADILQSKFGFDNRPFLEGLEQAGFYVADCSLSNYSQTRLSLASSLNIDYLENLGIQANSSNIAPIPALIKHSFVRQQLEAIGYRTIAFETGYDFTQLSDASEYLVPPGVSVLRGLTPFEAMLVQDTALTLINIGNSKFFIDTVDGIHTPFGQYIRRQRFVLDELERLPAEPGPKFVFVHIIVPHEPYVFLPDGTISNAKGASGNGKDLKDLSYLRQGYVSQVQFINNRMLPIVRAIQSNSKRPPIIVIQGDHGIVPPAEEPEEIRVALYLQPHILNAYYLPGVDYDKNLYASISPVNTFRLIFNRYFGGSYPMLADHSFFSTVDDLLSFRDFPEDQPHCK